MTRELDEGYKAQIIGSIPPYTVAFYPALHGLGSSLLDRSPYGNHGKITGATWKRLPRGLYVLNFNGSTDYVTVPDATSFDITTTLTVLCWVKCTLITISGRRWIFCKYLSTGNQREWGLAKPSGTGQIDILLGDPADGTFEGTQTTDSAYLVNGVWAFIGFVFNAGAVSIFVNGAEVASSLTSGAIPSSLFNGSANVKIGALGDNTSLFNGSIAFPRAVNSNMTTTEIVRIYNRERHLLGI